MAQKHLIIYILVILSLIIPASAYDITGDTVYIDDNNVYLSATPHTIASSGWVYFNLTSKQYTGDIDVVWGFNTSVSKPKKAELYAPHWENTTTDHEHTFYNVSQFQVYYGDMLDYGNPYNDFQYKITHEIPVYNEITLEIEGYETTISNVSFDSQVPDGDNHTAYWHTRHDRWVHWKDKTSTFKSTTYDYQGYDKWYYIKDVGVNAGQNYLLRAWVEVPISLTPQTGKYYYATKPSSETISEAIASGHFYTLDPWWNSSWNYYKTITINQGLVNQSIGNVHYTMLIEITDTDLRDHAQADADDIVFLTSDNTTQLDHQISIYNSTIGYLKAFVNVTDISNVPSINMYYNNSGATNTEDNVGTWGVNASGIWLTNEGSGSYANDSSGNNNNLTNSAGVLWEDGGLRYNGTTDSTMNMENLQDHIKISDEYTVLTRYKIVSRPYFTNTQVNTVNRPFTIARSGDAIRGQFSQGGSTYTLESGVSVGNGELASVGFSSKSGDQDIYVNGVYRASDNQTGDPGYGFSADIMSIGGTTDGIIYYLYVYNSLLSAAEITTHYNNSVYPSSFISVGAEQSDAPAGAAPNTTSWQNNKTSNNTLDFTINTSEEVNFNATANQTITTWNWYKDDADQSNNYDNITLNWSSTGLKHVTVNATNANGTSPSVAWNVTVIGPPTITLVSFTPTPFNTNYTGTTTISYLVESTNPLNLSSVAFLYGINYTVPVGGDMHNYISGPPNSIAYNGLYRAPHRNLTPYLSWEYNTTITEGNVWKWGGYDNDSSELTTSVINSTHTLVNVTGVTEYILPSSFYISKKAMYDAPKTGFEVNRQQGLIFKMWNVEQLRNRNFKYFANLYFDSSWESTLPTYPVEIGYCNNSYDPAVDDIDTCPYCTKFAEWDRNRWVNHSWNPGANASYSYPLVVNGSQYTEPTPDEINYIWLRSNTLSSKSYVLNATDHDPGITNITFAETNTMWTYNELNGVTSPIAYTPSFFTTFVRNDEELLHHLYISDDTGIWGHSDIFSEPIGISTVPISPVSFEYFNVTCDESYHDEEMDATYDQGTIGVGLHCPADPDGGNVSHNLTLHYYPNQTLVAVINNTFTTTGDEYVEIEVDTTAYYSSDTLYTFKCVSTDDESHVATKWLISYFALDADGNQGWINDDKLLFWGMNNIPTLYAEVSNSSLISYNGGTDIYTMHVPFFKSKGNDTFYFNETVHLESLNDEDVAYFRHMGRTYFDYANIYAWNTTTDTQAPATDTFRGYVYSLSVICGNITNSDFSYLGSDFYRQEGLNFVENSHEYLISNTTFSHNAEGPIMEFCSNMNISQCTITDNINVGVGIYFSNEIIIENCTIDSNGGRGITMYEANNNIIRYNDITNSGIHGVHYWSNSVNNTCTENDITGSATYDYYLSSSSMDNFIVDPGSLTDTIRVTSTSSVNIENTDNMAFSEDSLSTSYAYTTNFSMYVSGASQTFDITQRDMSIWPTTDRVNISNLEWNGVVFFDSGSDVEINPTLFNITNTAWIDGDVHVYKDGILYDNETADATGFISYNYSDSFLGGPSFEFRIPYIPLTLLFNVFLLLVFLTLGLTGYSVLIRDLTNFTHIISGFMASILWFILGYQSYIGIGFEHAIKSSTYSLGVLLSTEDVIEITAYQYPWLGMMFVVIGVIVTLHSVILIISASKDMIKELEGGKKDDY